MSKIYTSLHIEGQLIYNNNPQEGYVLTTDSFGLVSWTSSTSVLPTASNTDFGYMKLGQSLNINTSGVTEIATASSDRLGGVRVGSGLTVSNTGVLSLSGSGVSGNYLPLTGGTMSGDIHMNGAKIIGTDSNNYIQLASGYQYFYYEYDLRKSSIINNSGVELKGGFSDDSLYGDLVLNDTNSIFRYTKNGDSTSFTLSDDYSSGGGTASAYFEDSINNVGIVYIDDYSSNFVDNSLVTKKYVDSSYSVGLGLTSSNKVFRVATASSEGIGGIIVGSGLTVSNTGVLSVSGGGGTTYAAGVGLTLSGNTFSMISTNTKRIYVSVNGSDSNNGLSSLTPVLNLWKARDLAVSGDTVMVMPGSYIFDNRNSAGCPYNGLVQTKVNLWKDGVTYNFMTGAKIYSYGSTSISYSPYSDNMFFFQPNSLTYSVCSVVGDLEFYAISEGADNSGGAAYLFYGTETNVSSTYPGFTFYFKGKYIESITGCTPLSAIRTVSGSGTASIYIDVQKVRYGYTLDQGQGANYAFSTWRGGDNSDMTVNIKVNEIINNSGTEYNSIFYVRAYSTSGINKLKVNIDVSYASILAYSFLLYYHPWNTWPTINSLEGAIIKFNCDICVFSSTLFWIIQGYKNTYVTITGNYYCSGSLTGKYFSVSGYSFIQLWDQKNDGLSDNSIVDFKGTYYANNPTRTIVHVGGENTTSAPLYGYTNPIGNFTGDIYFTATASNYTGTLFYIDEGKFRFTGRIHGDKNYSGYGFNGSVMRFGGSSAGFLTNAHIYSDLNSSLVSYGTPVNGQSTLTIGNSFIDMTGTSSVIGDMRNLNTYIQNSTIRNRGTDDMFYNSLSTGTLQITNSTLINSSSTASTINYPLGTVIGAGAFSNKDIIISTLSGTVSVVSGLI